MAVTVNWFAVILVIFSCARITHLLADDYILSKPRDYITKRTELHPYLAYLATCTWCMSIWVAGAAILLLHGNLGLHGWIAWAAWPALSYAIVMLEALVTYLYDED